MIEMTCPLCGRHNDSTHWDSYMSDDPFEMENQITNLDRVLEELSDEEKSVIGYIENREMMCPMCQFLTEDIDDESDRGEFIKRLDKRIQKLDAKEADSVEFEEPARIEDPAVDSVVKEPELMEFDEDTDIERDERYDEENL